MTEAIEIKLDRITLRDDITPRIIINDDIVDEYRENIADLPPILLAVDHACPGEPSHHQIKNQTYVLIDGWHRYRAHDEAGHGTIMAIIDSELKPKDFFFTAVRANKAHGIRFDAAEKKKISKRLFIDENRTAAEISEAVGCSLRHASELIRELAHEKKQEAIKLAKNLATTGYSQRDIAEELVKRGFKASKSGVDRWLKPKPQDFTKEIEAINESQKTPPQIGESPKRDTMNVSEEAAIVTPRLEPEDFKKLYCAKCKKDSLERTGKWYKITVDTVDSSTCFDFMICSFCRRALGRWVRNE